MKKITFTAMVLAVAALFAACTKDGVYNPKEKISRIYESDSYTYYSSDYSNSYTTPKHLTELWHWDDNLLNSIDYYNEDGSLSYTYDFSYDGKRLSRADIYASSSYTEFTYDGRKLKKFESYYRGTLEETGTVTYDGNKVSKIEFMSFDKKGAKDNKYIKSQADLLNLIVPNFDKNEYMKNIATKGTETWTVKFTWDGKNVSKTETIEGSARRIIDYEYDNNKNPYNGFILADDIVLWGSANNITKRNVVTQYSDGTESRVYNYNYNYDGKWPTMQSYNYAYNGDGYSYSGTYITYFEYDDYSTP